MSSARDVGSTDLERVVRALLEGISRGELSASPAEERFLRSIVDLLAPGWAGAPAP